MSHELELDEEGNASMLYVGETPWHGLGVALTAEQQKTLTPKEAIKLCRADYEVSVGKLYTEEQQEVEARYTYRMKEGKKIILAPHVGVTYTPLQNADAFDWFEPFIEEGLLRIETAGVLRDGARVWIMASPTASSTQEVVPGDPIQMKVLLSNAHDGIQAARVGFTDVRVVCANTLAGAHYSKASQLLRIRHTANVKDALRLARKSLDAATQTFQANIELYAHMAATGINEKDMELYVRRVYAAPLDDATICAAYAAGDDVTLGSRIWQQVKPLIETGRGVNVPRVKGTLWGVYNAITEHVAWYRGKSNETRLESTWWGQGATIVTKALELAKMYLDKRDMKAPIDE